MGKLLKHKNHTPAPVVEFLAVDRPKVEVFAPVKAAPKHEPPKKIETKDHIMRWMCLGCGGFWSTGEKPIVMCPYCADRYYLDNILEDVPPRLTNCANRLRLRSQNVTDVGLDVKFCSLCGNADKRYAHDEEHLSLKVWQDKVLKEIGL